MWPPFARKPFLGTIAVTRQLNDAQEELALQELRTGRVPAGCVQVRRDPHTDIIAVVEPYVLHSFQLGAMPENFVTASWW